MVEAVARRVLGRDAVGELRTSEAWVLRAVVTVSRQLTIVPKTSVRRALGGSVRMLDLEEEDMVGWNSVEYFVKYWLLLSVVCLAIDGLVEIK